MGSRMGLLIVVVLAVLFTANTSSAVPLRMDYQITDMGALYNYEFSLVLDNNDSSWSPGMGWSWIIFGDRVGAASPLADFAGDPTDLPVGPFGKYTYSSGGHNGPTLLTNAGGSIVFWTPTGVGQSLYWSGTSANYLGQDSLFWSILHSSGGAPEADMERANLLSEATVPEPCSMLLFGIGCLGIAGARLRRKLAA
jgi:hypothetical protein